MFVLPLKVKYNNEVKFRKHGIQVRFLLLNVSLRIKNAVTTNHFYLLEKEKKMNYMKKTKRPPFEEINRGYQVMYSSDCSWHCKNGKRAWNPVMSSFGYPYVIKGFAINRAKNIMSWNHKNDISCYVLEQSTGEVVWRSWDER